MGRLEKDDSTARGVAEGAGQRVSDDVGALGDVVAAFQAGDDRERQFRWIFERFYRPLHRFFLRKGFDTDSSSDLTQETLLRVYRGLEGYEPQARFETWLYKIATTTYLKSLRSARTAKRKGEEVSADDAGELPAADRDPLGDVLEQERRRALHSALSELPPQMRRCLSLRLHHDLSYREIATVLGLSVETVKAHLFQARKRLESSLVPSLGS